MYCIARIFQKEFQIIAVNLGSLGAAADRFISKCGIFNFHDSMDNKKEQEHTYCIKKQLRTCKILDLNNMQATI